ncbi:MAG: FG-GAP-like repeat-containing protein [Planctomycetota bacterium]
MESTRRPALVLVSLVLLLAGCAEGPSWPPSDTAVAAMNEGLGHLERFDYKPAITSFERAVKLSPKWVDARVNLAVSLLNMRGEENHDRVATIAREIVAEEPDNPYAHCLVGMVLRIRGFTEEAVVHLERVVEIDPRDAAGWMNVGVAYNMLKQYDKALAAFEQAIELDPHLSAAYYARSTRLRREMRAEEADADLNEWRRLNPKGGNEPFQANLLTTLKAYHEVAKYAMAVRNYRGVERPTPPPATVTFADRTVESLGSWKYGGTAGPEFVPVDGASPADLAARIGPGVVLGDFDADLDTDVFLPEWGGTGKLYRNDGGWAFTDVTAEAEIFTKANGIGGVFFDGDGDGDMDLYVTAAGPNVYYENDGNGVFTDFTAERKLGGGDAISLGALADDLDHEGDIDLFVANYGSADALLRNNRDGTFTNVVEKEDASRTVGALTIDIDGDLDTDLLVLRDREPAKLLVNQRFMEFTDGALPEELTGTDPAWGAAAADIDLDGLNEVLVFRGPGANAALFRATPEGGLTFIGNGLSRLRWRTGLFLDVDLDGWLDLIGDDFVRLGEGGSPVGEATGPAVPADSRGMGFADFDGDGDLDRIVATHTGVKVIETKAPSDHHWLALKLRGELGKLAPAWSAKVGTGQEVEVRSGRLWQPLRARTSTGFLSSVEPFVRFGLDGHDVAEIVRIIWPDRVLQVEVEVPIDAVREIVEINRKPTSCPLLFAWDGEEFQFVTDFLGVGGLGFLAEPGVYGASDPDEYVFIGDWSKPIDGAYVLQLMEPLEEITYLDEAALYVVDHPADMVVRPNERFIGFPELFPKARIFAFPERILPKRATAIDGTDITKIVSTADRRYAPIEPDRRFLGFAAEHAVTLDFTGRIPELGKDERLVLVIDGWLEYGYSNDFYAAWQAKAPYIMPAIEVPDGGGGWRTVVENIGAPAGITKGMTWDLTGIISEKTPVFRIRSTMEVFWDRIALGVDRSKGRIRVTRVSPTSADLHHRGYPREFSPDGRMPFSYDYGVMDPTFTLKNIPGDYTRFGNVLPLVTAIDDRTATFSRGEEITVRFPTKGLPPLPEGHRRSLIFYAAGWCKDRDPYTGAGDSVGPLPWRGMSVYPPKEGEEFPPENREWIREWNTRKVRGN